MNYHTHFYLQILLGPCLLYKCIFKQRWQLANIKHSYKLQTICKFSLRTWELKFSLPLLKNKVPEAIIFK